MAMPQFCHKVTFLVFLDDRLELWYLRIIVMLRYKKVEKVTGGNRLKSLIYKDYLYFSTFLLLFFIKKIVIIRKVILSLIRVK